MKPTRTVRTYKHHGWAVYTACLQQQEQGIAQVHLLVYLSTYLLWTIGQETTPIALTAATVQIVVKTKKLGKQKPHLQTGKVGFFLSSGLLSLLLGLARETRGGHLVEVCVCMLLVPPGFRCQGLESPRLTICTN